MQIDIHPQNVELNVPLRAFIEEKMGDLEHLLGDAGQVLTRVEVGIPSNHHQSGQIYYCEVNVKIGGQLLRGQAENYDLHSAIVDVKDEMKVQIKRFKEKLQDKSRQPLPESTE